MKNRIWILLILVVSMATWFGISHSGVANANEAALSGFWNANQKLYMPRWDKKSVTGPSQANVTADSSQLTIFVRDNGGATYEFNASRSGNQLTGTITIKSGMGTFSHPFQGEISSDGSRITLHSDYIWTYNGKQDRWNKNYRDTETWEFTR